MAKVNQFVLGLNAGEANRLGGTISGNHTGYNHGKKAADDIELRKGVKTSKQKEQLR